VFLLLAVRSPASPATASDSPPNVAVLDFTVPADAGHDRSWAAVGLGDLFQIELQRLGMVTLDRDSIHTVLAEQRLAAGGLTAADYLKIGGLLNAPRLIAGNLTPCAGGRFRLDVQVFSVEAIETVVTVSAEGLFPKDLSSALRDVARQAARKMQSTSAPGGGSASTNIAPKPESLIMFYRGLNACAQKQPELGVAYFMNAEYLDGSFIAPLLWEIKAYELAGLGQFAEIRRTETADILNRFGIAVASHTNQAAAKPVLAVLAPVVTGGIGIPPPALESKLQEALLAIGQVRLFAFENIGDAMAEQDLKLSSFFASEDTPRYGRWLASDELVVLRVAPEGGKRIALDLALVNSLDGTTEARIHESGKPDKLDALTRAAVAELLHQWTNREKAPEQPVAPAEAPAAGTKQTNTDLRPDYLALAAALEQGRREPDQTDSHKALANAFGATGRDKLAAFEVEKCLQTVDMRTPGADLVFFGLHRWLFWEPNPVGGAMGMIDKSLIDRLTEQLFADYPESLCTGCMHYNLAMDYSRMWPLNAMRNRPTNWNGAVEEARAARNVIEKYCSSPPQNNPPVNTQSNHRGLKIFPKSGPFANMGECERELVAATYVLEGASLRHLGRLDEAREVLQQGQAFMQECPFRDNCLPLGPMVSDSNGSEQVPGYGGDPPNISIRLKEELALLETGLPQRPGAETMVRSLTANAGSQKEWLRCARQIAGLLKQEPSNDMEVLRQLLYWARISLTNARYRAAPSAVLRPLAQQFVDTYLAKLELSQWPAAPSVPAAKLGAAAVQVMEIYQSAGLDEEGWAAIEPLFRSQHPIGLWLDLLQQLPWDAQRSPQELKSVAARMTAGETNVPADAWLKLAQIYDDNHLRPEAFKAFQKAVAGGISTMQCRGLAASLLETAFNRNPEHPADEIERLRVELGFPPAEATWVEWFQAGRKYQTARPPDFSNATADYRGAIHFLENPEEFGLCHLEKQINSERIALRWGPSLDECDLQWSENYDRRWYSAAFYLAQCLIELNQKEEAAQWLRRIAIKVAGDSNIPLLERDDWHNSGWSSGPGLGIRAAEMLQKLHQTAEVTKARPL